MDAGTAAMKAITAAIDRRRKAPSAYADGAFLFEPISQEEKIDEHSGLKRLTKVHEEMNLGIEGFEKDLKM